MKNLIKRLAAAALLAAALLASCAPRAEDGAAETEEALFHAAFEPSPPVSFGEADAKTTEIVIPAAALGQAEGKLWLEGREVAGGYALLGDERYAALGAVLSALGTQKTEDEKGVRFAIGEDRYEIPAATGGLFANQKLMGTAVMGEGGIWLPLAPLAASTGLASAEDGGDLYYATVVKSAEVPRGVRVPVLMYHAVSDDTWGIKELFVKPSEMEKQLKYLTEHGYTTITFEDLPRLGEISKPVMLTFDDGYRDNYEELFPLLLKYNCKATIFMIAGKEGKPHYMTADMLSEMSASGLVSIQSHTVTHPKLGEISEAKQRAEMEESRQALVRMTHRIPFVLCYPSGSYNAVTRAAGADYYAFGIRMNGGIWNTSGDPFLVPRCYVSRETSLSAFARLLT